MPATPEDQRSAANIYTSLSSYVITASLGVIAAQAAVATFVLDKRDHLTFFYVWMVTGLIASVASIVAGGRGIAGIASAGFSGAWTLKPKRDYFNWQATLCLAGMLFLLCSVFSGTPKPENREALEEIKRLKTSTEQLSFQLHEVQGQYNRLNQKVESMKCPDGNLRGKPKSSPKTTNK